MVSALLVFLLFGLLQVALFLYVRSIVSASVSDAARYSANVNVDSDAGGLRAHLAIGHALSASMARRLTFRSGDDVDGVSGLATVRVECRGHIASIFFPIGALLDVNVDSESLKETR